MKKLVCLVLSILLITSIFVGCSKDGKKETAKNQEVEQKKTKEGKEILEVSWFEGGGGKKYIEEAIRLFEEKYPNIEVDLQMSPKNHEQLRPRFVGSNPPDVFQASSSFFDYFALIAQNKLRPLNDLLETESPRGEGKFKDIFMGNVLGLGFKDGNYYLAPIKNIYHGLWYSEKFMKDNNWDIPTNYDEWVEVSEKMNNKGQVPFVYQGLYPQYPIRSLLYSFIGSNGGQDVLANINNLEAGAWQDEAVVKSLTQFKDYTDKYLYSGTMALNHTQAQMEFINNRTTFITCGNWLENEMRDNIPDDFNLKYLVPPVNQPGNDDKYVFMQVEYMAIPSEAKNPEAAEKFVKFMYNQQMIDTYASKAGITIPVVNNTEGIEDKLPKTVVDVNRRVQNKDVIVTQQPWEQWYKPLFSKLKDQISFLISGKITPEEACEVMEKEAERIRKDDLIPKYKLN